MAIEPNDDGGYFVRMSRTTIVTAAALRKLAAAIEPHLDRARKLADEMDRLEIPDVRALGGITAGRSPGALDDFLSDVRKKLDRERPVG